jgi:hypothetical protein
LPRNDLLPPSVRTLDRIDNAEVASWADFFEALSAKSSEASPRHQKMEGGLLISLPSWPGQVLNRFFGPIKSTSEGVDSIVSFLKSYRQTSGVHPSFQIRAADVQLGQMLVKHGLVASDHSWARFLRVPDALERPKRDWWSGHFISGRRLSSRSPSRGSLTFRPGSAPAAQRC